MGSYRLELAANNGTPGSGFGGIVIEPTLGNVGIGKINPTATLDVAGTISASDAIQVSGSSLTCSSAIRGAIRYSNISNTLEFCNSSVWGSLSGSGAGGGTPGGVSGSIQFNNGTAFGGRNDIVVDSIGNIGIGTASPNHTLDVSGTARFTSSTAIGMSATPSATLDVSGTLKIAGTGTEGCDDQHLGMFRRNPATGAIQVCASR